MSSARLNYYIRDTIRGVERAYQKISQHCRERSGLKGSRGVSRQNDTMQAR